MADQEVPRLVKALERFNAIADEEARVQSRAASSWHTDDDDGGIVAMTPEGSEREEEASTEVEVPVLPIRVREDEATQQRRNATLLEHLKKVNTAFRAVKDKELIRNKQTGVVYKAVYKALCRCLQHSLFSFAAAAYEPLAKEACGLCTEFVRSLRHHGGDFATVITPGLLDRLETDSTEVYACLCAIASHSFHKEALMLTQVLQAMVSLDMDALVRRQCYGLVKIIVEKWPSLGFSAVDDLCQRLVLDIGEGVEEFVVPAMASLVVVCRKWPDVGVNTVRQLPRAKEVRLYKEYPQLRNMLSPRRARRKSFAAANGQAPPAHPSPTRLEPANAHSPGFGGNLTADRRLRHRQTIRYLPHHPSHAGLDPVRANTTITSRQGTVDAPRPANARAGFGREMAGGRLQDFVRWKIARDGGLVEALNQQQHGGVGGGLDSLDVSEDGSTTSSISMRSADNGNGNSSRGSTPQGVGVGVGGEELRRRRSLTMLSPTLRHCLSNANTNTDAHNNTPAAAANATRGLGSLRQSPITPDSAQALPLYSDPPSAASSCASSPTRPLHSRPLSNTNANTNTSGGSRIAMSFQNRQQQQQQQRHNTTLPHNTTPNTSASSMDGGVPPGPLPLAANAVSLPGSGRPSFYLSSEDVSRDPSRNPSPTRSRDASPPPSHANGAEAEDRENRGNRYGNTHNTNMPTTHTGGMEGKKVAAHTQPINPIMDSQELVREEKEEEEGVVSGGLDAEEEEELARLMEGEEELEGRVLFDELCVEDVPLASSHRPCSSLIGRIEEEDETDLHSSSSSSQQPSPLHPLIAPPLLAPPSPGHFSMDPTTQDKKRTWGPLLLLSVGLTLCGLGLWAHPSTRPRVHHLWLQGRAALPTHLHLHFLRPNSAQPSNSTATHPPHVKISSSSSKGGKKGAVEKVVVSPPAAKPKPLNKDLPKDTKDTKEEAKTLFKKAKKAKEEPKPKPKETKDKKDKGKDKKTKTKGVESVAIADVQPLPPPPPPTKTKTIAQAKKEKEKTPADAPKQKQIAAPALPDKDKAPDKAPERSNRNIALFSWRAPLSSKGVPASESAPPSPVIAPAPTSRHGPKEQHSKARDAASQALLPPLQDKDKDKAQGEREGEGEDKGVGMYYGREGKRRRLPPWRKKVKKNLLDPLGRLLRDGLRRLRGASWQALGLMTFALLLTLALV